jgi:uncharacterized protein involved in exopolysaccharide biosynthesis
MRTYPDVEDVELPAGRTSLHPQPSVPALPEVKDRPSNEAASTAHSEISPGYIAVLELLWQARAALKKAAIAGMLAGFLIAFLLPVRYEAVTRLMPPDSQSGAGMAMLQAMAAKTGAELAAVSGDLLGLKSSGALFIGILTSSTVQQRLVDRFDLRKIYGQRWDEEARRELAEHTGISEDRHSGIISITVTDHRRERAAAIAAAYVEELNRLVAELSTSQAHRERVFLEQRLAAVKQNLDQAARQFSEFSSRNSAIDIKEQGRAMIEAAATLTGQLIAAQSELSGLEQIYNPNNVRVKALEARVAELQSKLAQLGGDEQNLDSSSEARLYPDLKQLPLLGVTYENLFRENKIQETVYETLTQEYEMAKVEEAKEMPSVKILDPARVPERRSYPPRLRVILVGVLLSVACRSAWILARQRWSEVDCRHPGKRFALEVWSVLRVSMSEWRTKLRAAWGHGPATLSRQHLSPIELPENRNSSEA